MNKLRKPCQWYLIVLLSCIGFLTVANHPVWGQSDYKNGKVFAGYSYARIPTIETPFLSHRNGNGWNFSVSANINRFLGVTADFGGQYGNLPSGTYAGRPISLSLRFHEFLVGPRLMTHNGSVTGFAHFLMGGVRRSIGVFSASAPDGSSIRSTGYGKNEFAMGFGGGLDINLNNRFALRAAQVDDIIMNDYTYTGCCFSGGPPLRGWRHSFRLATGIVFKF
ncbi:MAG: hypothetical protein HYR55_20890 [Acidobacteria bacterium]|nr:hypothetical protein [Acidobacteriota bacterium]